MSRVNPHTGQTIYNANERAGMRNEDGVWRAEKLSPEEQEKIRQEQLRAEQERRAQMQREKRKESAWTETKLKILALQGAHKRTTETRNPTELDMPAGSITENLTRVDPILYERFGEPREFMEDMNMILSGFENEKIVVEGNEMQKINEYGKKYLLGLLLQKHIFEQGFSISVDKNNQPVLRDEKGGNNPQRQEQLKGLQEALGQFEFSKNVRNILKKNDNSSLIAEYIAANTYEKHPNLVDYRNSLARKMGITSPNISPEQAQKILESTSLTPGEKSFLLAWKDSQKDTTLAQVQEQQETFVKYARENVDKKTPETHLRELAERPFTKSAQLLAGGAIGAALLYFAYKQMKKGGVWGTLSGIIAGLIGGAIVLPLGDKAWKALGMSDALKDIQEGKPVDREKAKDNPYANLDINIIEPIKTNLARLQARLAGGQEGIEILMNQKVGQKIAKEYPVYSMLGVLNPDKTTIGGVYHGPIDRPGIQPNDINTGFNDLSSYPDQRSQLNNVLTYTWERYQKTAKFQSQSEPERKSMSFGDMLAALEKEDGWLNQVIDAVSDEPEKKEALKVIGKNPKEWGKIPLKDIKRYFLNIPDDPGATWRNTHPTISALIGIVPNSVSILTNYFRTMQDEIQGANESTTLQEFLLK